MFSAFSGSPIYPQVRSSPLAMRSIVTREAIEAYERRVFLNPPFGYDVEDWFSKLFLERLESRTTEAIVLWKSATETAAWKTLTRHSCRVCFPSSRVRFSGPGSDELKGPTFSPALFYVGPRPERFEEAFRHIGDVWVVPVRAELCPGQGSA